MIRLGTAFLFMIVALLVVVPVSAEELNLAAHFQGPEGAPPPVDVTAIPKEVRENALALVTQDDVLKSLEHLGIEPCREPRFAHEPIAQDDVTLELPASGLSKSHRSFVFQGFPRIVEEDPGHGQVGVHLGIKR